VRTLIFFAAFGICNVASAAATLNSGVSVVPNPMLPEYYVNLLIVGPAAEDLFNAIGKGLADQTFNSNREVRLSPSALCNREVVQDEARQASVVKYECTVYVATKR
jgi:hypothetical protein